MTPTYYTLTPGWFLLRYISDCRRLQWLRTPYHPPYLDTLAPLTLISILICLSFTKHNLIYGLKAKLPIDIGRKGSCGFKPDGNLISSCKTLPLKIISSIQRFKYIRNRVMSMNEMKN